VRWKVFGRVLRSFSTPKGPQLEASRPQSFFLVEAFYLFFSPPPPNLVLVVLTVSVMTFLGHLFGSPSLFCSFFLLKTRPEGTVGGSAFGRPVFLDSCVFVLASFPAFFFPSGFFSFDCGRWRPTRPRFPTQFLLFTRALRQSLASPLFSACVAFPPLLRVALVHPFRMGGMFSRGYRVSSLLVVLLASLTVRLFCSLFGHLAREREFFSRRSALPGNPCL